MTAKAPASTATVAHELVDLCRKGRNLDAVNQFYSPRIVSVESSGSPEMPAEMSGIDAIRGKHEWWDTNNDVHSDRVGALYGAGREDCPGGVLL